MSDKVVKVDIPKRDLVPIFHYGAHPLWAYLKDILEIDITDICKYVTAEVPLLDTDSGDKLACSVFDIPHREDLPSEFNDDHTFLLNSINTVFNAVKDATLNGVKILAGYKFILDENKVLVLVDEDDHPVAPRGIAVVRV